MLVYDKSEIRDSLTLDNIYSLLQNWGGEPVHRSFGLVSATICHNAPGEGSQKLYYYENSKLFHCYTGCENPSFDIFELVIKVMEIQENKILDLNDAVRWIANKFNIAGHYENDEYQEVLEDWKYFSNYERIQNIEVVVNKIVLKEYDSDILERFNYNIKITPWLEEGIKQSVMDNALIGYYPGGEQITIPHFDIDGRLVGIRGRSICIEDIERFGKYRPLYINQQLYNHPLGMNLYNLNNSKDKIQTFKKVFIFESEKSCLKYQSYFGIDNDISVACCGSNISNYQVQLLLNLGVEEIIIAFDKQYERLGNEECMRWSKKLEQIHNKYKNEVLISYLWDKKDLLEYKDSPIDEGPEKFLKLFKERIIL
jgi:hypothetical protein